MVFPQGDGRGKGYPSHLAEVIKIRGKLGSPNND